MFYHLMVFLRLGWLMVFSSKKMVEQELYFLLNDPCYTHTHTHTVTV